jgi:N-acetyl-anhydromuramyl-L-alanine amidase AmpD
MTEDYSLMELFGRPPSRSLDDITEIVIHHTDGGGTNKSLFEWFKGKDCPNHALYRKFVALTHYFIQKDGAVTEAYPLDTWLYHSCSGVRDKTTIGIELIHKTGEFTQEQYAALLGLIFIDIAEKCPNIDTISSHDYRYLKYSGRSKGCPGKFFDWDIIEQNNQFNWIINK